MNVAVVYQSNYGYTEKYANWVAEELQADVFQTKEVKLSELMEYETIIIGGGLYAGGMNSLDFLMKYYNELKEKNLCLFTVGAADVTNTKNVQNIQQNLFKSWTVEMKESIKVYHFRGGIDYPNLRFMHKVLMSMLILTLRLKKQVERDEETQEMIDTYGQKTDFTNKESIEPMLEDINNIAMREIKKEVSIL
jgi:menaquinone-dependent protoporphyrinogen IX oxidase